MNTFLTFLCPDVLMYDFLLRYSNFNFIIQDLKYEENSVKAVQCLNDMVTNALMHAEDCLKYMSALRDPPIFRFCAIPQVLFFYLISSDLTVIQFVSLMSCSDILSFISMFLCLKYCLHILLCFSRAESWAALCSVQIKYEKIHKLQCSVNYYLLKTLFKKCVIITRYYLNLYKMFCRNIVVNLEKNILIVISCTNYNIWESIDLLPMVELFSSSWVSEGLAI